MKVSRIIFLFVLIAGLLAYIPLAARADRTHQPTLAPTLLHYETPVTLSGALIREWDMSWVGTGDTPNTQDPKVAAEALVQAAKIKDDRPHKPSMHCILRLTQPISLVAGNEPDVNPAESNIAEIDVLMPDENLAQKVEALNFGKKQFRVTGTLEHANTVHQLRPVFIMAKSVNAVN